MPIEASDAYNLGKWVSSKDKMDTYTNANTHHIQSPAEALGANVSPLFQSVDPDIIHSPLCLSVFLCHSDALRCVRSYIHHLSRALVIYPTHTHSSRQHFCPLLYEKKKKNWGIWWLNDPIHLLYPSSRYHIHFMLSFSLAFPERQPLRLTVSSLWLHYHISRDKYKG